MTILENLYNQAAHVFGNVEQTRIASSEMPQAPAIHQVKRADGTSKRVTKLPKEPKTPRAKKVVGNRDLSVEFTPETMASVPRVKRETKAQKKAREDLAKQAMAEQVNLIEANRTAPTHTEPIPAPPTRKPRAKKAETRENPSRVGTAKQATPENPSQVVATLDEEKALVPYVPPESGGLVPYEPPAQSSQIPAAVAPYVADNVNMDSIVAALTVQKKVRAPRKKGGSLRALANSASFAAQVATHAPIF